MARYSGFASLVLLILLCTSTTGCGLFGSDDDDIVDVSGDWSTVGVAPSLGECCSVDLTISQDGNDLSGNGDIAIPGGAFVGEYNSLAVSVDGTVTGNSVSVTLTSDQSSASINGDIVEEEHLTKIDADFIGFGETKNGLTVYVFQDD